MPDQGKRDRMRIRAFGVGMFLGLMFLCCARADILISEVMASNDNDVFQGWNRANITLFGTVLTTYDDDTLTWSAEGFGYVAKWDDENHKIIIAQA